MKNLFESKPEKNTPFKILVTLVSLAGLAVFFLPLFTGNGLLGLGIVLIFTGLIGWTTLLGIQAGSIVQVSPPAEDKYEPRHIPRRDPGPIAHPRSA
jgi:hypothetical protein